VALVTAELPFGRNRRFAANSAPVLDKFIGGWQITVDLLCSAGSRQPTPIPADRRAHRKAAERPGRGGARVRHILFPKTALDLAHNLRTCPTALPTCGYTAAEH